ncbi:hypothetical protein LOD99_2046 [Oopsacas minuta]|uniref:Uncharacterized protein n=1 Tax=Oopsacas minuta TaxID=111878 RepID=A0AAV7K2T3_9METZ|nr:hypothetical protein LOD99_2046 [Oopsacas minuta]
MFIGEYTQSVFVKFPKGVVVDNTTGNINVADWENYSVKVVNKNSKFLFKFVDRKIEHPIWIAICGDRILISQGSGHILNYEVNGKLISRVGKSGKGELTFNNPRSLTIDESTGEVYICDSYNNHMQILSKELGFKTQFGHDKLSNPLDVKPTREFRFILDLSNPCLHLYNYNLIL